MKKIKSAGSNNATVWAALFGLVLLLFFNIVTCHLYEHQALHQKAQPSIKRNHSSRRLLLVKTAAAAAAAANDVQTKGYYLKGNTKTQQPKKAVEASLRRAPCSVPNPTQNK